MRLRVWWVTLTYPCMTVPSRDSLHLTIFYSSLPGRQELVRQHGTGTKTHRSGEWDREPGNRPMHLWLTHLRQMRQEHTMEKTQSLQ